VIAQIARVVADAVDEARLAATQEGSPMTYTPGASVTTPPSWRMLPFASSTGTSSQE
jgi:hypothetical protein